MARLPLLILVLLATACSLPAYKPTTIRELLPVGATLRLTRPLEIPAGHAYVYIAHGEPVAFKAYNTVNIYKPYCQFHLDKSSQSSRVVKVDRFRVTRVVEWPDYHGRSGAIRYARLQRADLRINGGLSLGTGVQDDAGPSTVMYATIIGLHSETQPAVTELVCGHWDTQGVVEPLTLEEMRSALGGLIVVEATGGTPGHP